jgi:hypothetical protein
VRGTRKGTLAPVRRLYPLLKSWRRAVSQDLKTAVAQVTGSNAFIGKKKAKEIYGKAKIVRILSHT